MVITIIECINTLLVKDREFFLQVVTLEGINRQILMFIWTQTVTRFALNFTVMYLVVPKKTAKVAHYLG